MELNFLFPLLIIMILVGGLGLMYKSWLEGKTESKEAGKTKEDILKNMLKKAEDEFQASYKGKEPDKLAAVLSKNFSLFIKDNPYRIEGSGESLTWIKTAMEESAGQSIFNQSLEMLGSESAVVTFTWIRGKHTGKTTHVWKYQDNVGWKLVHDHTSYNMSDK